MLYIKNTKNHYGLVTISFHWILAFLIIFMICLGLYMADLPISEKKLRLYGLHKEFGVLILMLVLARLFWRISNIMPSLAELPAWERISARLVHWLFYIILICLPLSGWLLSSAAGVSVSFFGLFTLPDLIGADKAHREFFDTVHQALAFTLIGLICLHVAAALKHFIIDKDTILQRMLSPLD